MLLLHLYLPIPPPVVLSAKVHLFSLIYLTVHNCNGMKRLVARQKKVNPEKGDCLMACMDDRKIGGILNGRLDE